MSIRTMWGILSTAIQNQTTPRVVCEEIELTIRAAMRSDVQLPHYIEIRALARTLGRWPRASEVVEHFSSLPDLESLFPNEENIP